MNRECFSLFEQMLNLLAAFKPFICSKCVLLFLFQFCKNKKVPAVSAGTSNIFNKKNTYFLTPRSSLMVSL
jgi:hypothetical protein